MQSSLNPRVKKNYRPIICSMFSFFMMYESRLSDLKLRAIQSGSIEPFLTHLFLGCLVFESLMKMKYADKGTNTLGGYINKAIKHKDLGIQKKIYKTNKTYSFQKIIDNLKSLEKKGNFGEVCVGINYMIRNTTGHSLNWPDKFNEEIYEKLFRHISSAILWLIFKKYLT